MEQRRSGALGWAILIFGVLGLVFATFEYSVYSTNRETLDWNEAWGEATPEDWELVRTQLTITIAAFSVSTILIAIGVAVMLNAYLYNQELDRTELLDAVKGLRK